MPRHTRAWHKLHDEALAEFAERQALKRRAEAPMEEGAPAPAWESAPPVPGEHLDQLAHDFASEKTATLDLDPLANLDRTARRYGERGRYLQTGDRDA